MLEIHRTAVLCTACIFWGTTAATAPSSQPDDDGQPARPAANPATQTSTTESVSPAHDENRPDLWALDWFGLRPKVAAAGFTFAGTWWVDYSKNLQGGLSTDGDALRNLLDLRFNVDTGPVFGFKGGTFSIEFENQAGDNASTNLVGDIQGFDNADADGRLQLDQLWYQQTLFDERLRVKIGKVDANTEFALPAAGTPFLNSSFAYSQTVFVMPTYPDPAMSVNVFLKPTPKIDLGFGVYDGSGALGIHTGSYGPKHFFTGTSGYFLIGQADLHWGDALPGRLVLGGWGSTSTFTRFDGSTTSGTGGFYSFVEQTIWRRSTTGKSINNDGLTTFLQYGHADAHVSPFVDHVGGGLTFVGPLVRRPYDTVAVGATYVHLSDEPGAGFTRDFELSIEGVYSAQVTSYLLLQPDIQYIIHPGGNHPNAVVVTLRATLSF